MVYLGKFLNVSEKQRLLEAEMMHCIRSVTSPVQSEGNTSEDDERPSLFSYAQWSSSSFSSSSGVCPLILLEMRHYSFVFISKLILISLIFSGVHKAVALL